MKIALYGGSFNPPHRTHQAIIQWLATKFDQVWVIPCMHHAFEKDLADFGLRMQMCKQMVGVLQVPTIHVIRRSETYTFDLVKHLKAERPEVQWVVIVGQDILAEAIKWHRWDDLQAMAEIHVIGRVQEGGILEPDHRKYEFTPPGVSSTKIRELLKDGKVQEARRLMPEAVWPIIRENHLYGVPEPPILKLST